MFSPRYNYSLVPKGLSVTCLWNLNTATIPATITHSWNLRGIDHQVSLKVSYSWVLKDPQELSNALCSDEKLLKGSLEASTSETMYTAWHPSWHRVCVLMLWVLWCPSEHHYYCKNTHPTRWKPFSEGTHIRHKNEISSKTTCYASSFVV